MALRFDANGDYLTRTANLPAGTAFTLCGWFKLVGSGGGTNELIAGIIDAGATHGYVLYTRLSGTYSAAIYNPDAGAPVTAGSLSTGQWYYGALSCSGTGATDAKLRYAALGATAFTSATTSGYAFTPATVGLGEFLGAGQWANASVAGWKLFDRALTDAELLAEMNRLTPASTTNLNLWTPMVHNSVANAVKDFSGNGRNWTTNGSLSVEDGPPVGWDAPVLVVGQSAASGSYTLTADGGSFVLTGSSAGTLFNRVLSAGSGSFVLTGADATLTYNTSSGGTVNGQTLTATLSLIAGSVNAGALVSGSTVSTTLSLLSGSVNAGAAVSGQTVSSTMSLVAGSISAGSLVSGTTLITDLSLIAGSASAIQNATVDGYVFITNMSLITGNAFTDGTVKVYNRLLFSPVQPLIRPLIEKIINYD